MKLWQAVGSALSLGCLITFGFLASAAYTETSYADTADLSTYTNRIVPDNPALSTEAMVGTAFGIVNDRVPVQLSEGDLECMIKNIYFEAGTESWIGKIAVGRVTLNRVADQRYPASVCDVVYDGYRAGRRDCQFSWYCDGKSDRITESIRASKNYQDSERAALMVILGGHEGLVEGATHYHANYVRPIWRHELTFITRIDTHIFYRWE